MTDFAPGELRSAIHALFKANQELFTADQAQIEFFNRLAASVNSLSESLIALGERVAQLEARQDSDTEGQ